MSIYLAGSLRDLDPVYAEALCAMEALARFGVRDLRVIAHKVADVKTVLFADQTKDDDLCLFVHGQNGTSEITFGIGPTGCSAEEFPDHWSKAFETLRSALPAESAELWQRSKVANLLPTIAERLKAKGFVLP